MLTVYLISIAVYAAIVGWGAKLSVDCGETITVQNIIWFTLMGFTPVLQQVVIMGGLAFLFDHYKDVPVFGEKKQ